MCKVKCFFILSNSLFSRMCFWKAFKLISRSRNQSTHSYFYNFLFYSFLTLPAKLGQYFTLNILFHMWDFRSMIMLITIMRLNIWHDMWLSNANTILFISVSNNVDFQNYNPWLLNIRQHRRHSAQRPRSHDHLVIIWYSLLFVYYSQIICSVRYLVIKH